MSRPSHLRLVAFSPNDYSLGSVLTRSDRSEIIRTDSIAAALSLLFQFPSYSDAYIVQEGFDPCHIELDYDHEERSVSELHVRLPNQNRSTCWKEGETISIRFEIFRRCFEFSTKVLGVDGETFMIVEAPEILVTYQNGRLPRTKVPSSERTKLPKCNGMGTDGKTIFQIEILELGVNAIKLKVDEGSPHDLGYFCFNEIQVPLRFLRSDGEFAGVFLLKPNTAIEYGAIFDLYRKIAYPHLKPRSEFSYGDLIKLYSDETGYLDKFETSDDAQKRELLIADVWETLSPAQHQVTADYITVDEKGQPAGASSVALGFTNSDRPVWVFHQLCAKTNPNLLEQSGDLYTWRAEYLAGRSENLDTIVWFDSRSRWLERIYVKFATQSRGAAKLLPVQVRRTEFLRNDGARTIAEGQTASFGHTQRYFAETDKTFGGIGPRYLNAARILDAIITLSEDDINSHSSAIAQKLMLMANLQSVELEVSVPHDKKDAFTLPYRELVNDVDRLCLFTKDSLVDFISSVEHSVAVTAKKKSQGEFGSAS
jgi:hypothetical protein